MKEGLGIFYKNKNESFRGYFKNDKMNGFGKFKNEKTEFYGYWENDDQIDIIYRLMNDLPNTVAI